LGYLGIAMIAYTLISLLLQTADAFSITCLVWGSLLVTLSVLVDHRLQGKEIEKTVRLRRLETLEEGMNLKKELLGKVLADGLPENLSREWVERILDWNHLEQDLPETNSKEISIKRTQSC
jgi:hypothetical protein